MSVTFNTNAVKYREEVGDQWAPLTMHVESEVNAVVQDEEPLGSENVWFDTSDETEVQIPTMDDLRNSLQYSYEVLFNKTFTNGTPSSILVSNLNNFDEVILAYGGSDNTGFYNAVTCPVGLFKAGLGLRLNYTNESVTVGCSYVDDTHVSAFMNGQSRWAILVGVKH